MRKHVSVLMLFLSLLLVGVLVSACGSSKVGTIPSGTPDIGNGVEHSAQTICPQCSTRWPSAQYFRSIIRRNLPLEFTKMVRKRPLVERFSQAMNGRFPGFAPNSYVSLQNRSKFGPIYQWGRRRSACRKQARYGLV